jgi:hypothetical protein
MSRLSGGSGPCTYHEGIQQSVRAVLTLTWALGGSEWQLHVPAALVPERKPPVLTEYEAEWATGPVGML